MMRHPGKKWDVYFLGTPSNYTSDRNKEGNIKLVHFLKITTDCRTATKDDTSAAVD